MRGIRHSDETMLTTFRFGSNEKHIREALTVAFKRRGVDLAELDPSIRSTMVTAAFSTGVEEQVEAFTRLARVAEQFDLPDDLRRQVAVKAYSSYAESLPCAESTIVRSDAGSEQRLRPSIRAPLRPEFRNVLLRDRAAQDRQNQGIAVPIHGQADGLQTRYRCLKNLA